MSDVLQFDVPTIHHRSRLTSASTSVANVSTVRGSRRGSGGVRRFRASSKLLPVSPTFGTDAILFAGRDRNHRAHCCRRTAGRCTQRRRNFALHASTVDSATPAFQVTAPTASTAGRLSATAGSAVDLLNDLHELRYRTCRRRHSNPAHVRVAVFDVRSQHRALNSENRITAADFEGWIQERGAYSKCLG